MNCGYQSKMFEYMITKFRILINRFSNLFNEIDGQFLDPFYHYSIIDGNRVESVEKRITKSYKCILRYVRCS